jgi:hypothetical protein
MSFENVASVVASLRNFFTLRGTQYKVMMMSQVPQKNSESSRPGIEVIFDSLRIEGLP